MAKPVIYGPDGREVRSEVKPFYQGTVRGRYRSALTNQVSDSRKTLNKWARETLLGYARTLFVNFGQIKGAVTDLARYSVGKGIRPQSHAKTRAAEYEQFFNDWATNADFGGQYTFWGMQKLASIRMDVDGDIGFNLVNGENNWPYLQAIEGHRIKGPKQDENIFDGVVISPRTGRPAAYMVSEGEKFKRIPAANFVLVSAPNRVNQYRGITALEHAVTEIWDVADILSYEKVGVKMRSAIGAVVTTEGGTVDDGTDLVKTGYTASDTKDVPWSTFSAGTIPHLKPGESITDLGTNRPSLETQHFLEMLMRQASVGLGLPFEFVWDPTKAGGANQRAVLAKADRVFMERACLIDERLNSRVWTWVIAKAIKRGDVGPDEDWWRTTWQHPKRITVDVGREAKEAREDIKYGTKTLAEDASERGQDWVEIRQQREAETSDLLERSKRLSEQFEVPLETAINLLSQQSPNPSTETNDPNSNQQAA